jgi:NAD(P)-dependent dehydrogenase (short-subunit alcohol dehydrogenase family)
VTKFLIVGGDRDVGLSLCKQLAGTVCAGSSIGVIPCIDVTSESDVRPMIAKLRRRDAKIDVIIHAVEAFGPDPELGKLDYANLRHPIAVNTISPLRVV